MLFSDAVLIPSQHTNSAITSLQLARTDIPGSQLRHIAHHHLKFAAMHYEDVTAVFSSCRSRYLVSMVVTRGISTTFVIYLNGAFWF
jgi:hypothetical protein